MNHSEFTKYHKFLKDKLHDIQQELSECPPGKLIISKGPKYDQWFYSDGKSKKYIKKKDIAIAQKLAYKKYLTLLHEELSQKEKLISKCTRYFSPDFGKLNALLLSNPSFINLISPYFVPVSKELNDWISQDYNTNPKHPENLLHKTISGHVVRSKSEAMIASLLYSNKIPFRYECELILKDCILYPDFTIKHPNSGKIYYWEHFGMIENPDYLDNICKKLKHFCYNNIYPSDQLILTFETSNAPLSTTGIQSIIDMNFK